MRAGRVFNSTVWNTLTKARPTYVRYGNVLVTIGAAALLRTGFNPIWETNHPYIFFFPALVFVTWVGGMGPGLLAIALSRLATPFISPTPPTLRARRLSASSACSSSRLQTHSAGPKTARMRTRNLSPPPFAASATP